MATVRIVNTNPGTQHPISTIVPPAGSSPANVLYMKIHYDVLADGTLSTAYSYEDVSGFYPLGSGISAFLNGIRNGGPDIEDQLSPIPSNTLVPIIEDPCYIVFSVDFAGRAQFDNPAISTDDDTGNEYFNLNRAQDSAAHPTDYHMAYLRAISPSFKGYYEDDEDSFNLYFNVSQPGGGTKKGMIDPAIKNSGHDGGTGLFATMRAMSKAKAIAKAKKEQKK